MNIRDSYEEPRGCGYRKDGGLYLVSGSLSDSCGKLPIPLNVCPTCHGGIKPSRGWTWVGFELIKDVPCSKKGCTGCYPFDGSVERFGLIWIGEKFYPTPYEFNREAIGQGISRRISAIPNEFVLGETWVLLAHRKCISINYHHGYQPKDDPLNEHSDDDGMVPGIFCVFKPTAIEYAVKEDDQEEKLEKLEKRGITLIRVHPLQTKIELHN